MAKSLASIVTTNGREKSGKARTGAPVKAAFKPSKDFYWDVPQTKGTFFASRRERGSARCANLGTNLW